MIYKSFNTRRAFGVEIETSQTLPQKLIKEIILSTGTVRKVTVCSHIDSKNNKNWHVKTDLSCGGRGEDCGWEIASYKASGFNDLIDVGQTAKRLRDCGLKVNNSCGFHVHCDVSDFDAYQMGFLLARWVAIEPWLFNAVPIRRSMSIYCKGLRRVCPIETFFLMKGSPVVKPQYNPIDLWNHFKPEYENYGRNDCRRVALNLLNFYNERDNVKKKRCTVELRMPESSLREVDVKNWTRFFVHFVETSFRDKKLFPLKATTLDQFFDGCGIGHDGNFSILSPGLRETKLWLLKRLRKYMWNLGKIGRQDVDDYIYRMTWPEKPTI